MAEFIHIDDIKIKENRFRKTFTEKNLGQLQESISSGLGLIHALTITREGFLNTGESRLKAIKALYLMGTRIKFNGTDVPIDHVPVEYIDCEEDAIDLLKAELHENVHRENFTYLEECEAIARIARLEQAILNKHKNAENAEAAKPLETVPDDIPLRDISQEAKKATTAALYEGKTGAHYGRTVQDSLTIQNILETRPESDLAKKLTSAKTMTEASKILEQKKQEDMRINLAAAQGKNFNNKIHTIIHGDCLEEMKKLPQESFTACICDPIYGIGAHKFGDAAGKMSNLSHNYEDTPENFHKIMPEALKLVSKLLKPAAHIYLACDIRNYFALREYLEKASTPGNPWRIPNHPVIQYKVAGGRIPHPGFTFRRSWELWLYAYRGEKQEYTQINDVIECSSNRTETHGANKPVDLLKAFAKRSCLPGDSVIDFMAGSGPIITACHELKVKCTAIESDAAYYGRILERVKELK